MLKSFIFILILLFFHFNQDRQPMQADHSRSAAYRWLNKEVLDGHLVDDMESLDHWVTFARGGQQVVDARVDSHESETDRQICRMMLSGDRFHSGRHALRMIIPTKLDEPGPASGRGWGTAGVVRQFDGEDWTGSNRISLWIYPDCPGFYINWLELRIYNDGEQKLPALFGQEGETSILLRNHEWNQVVWEIGNVERDRVTGLEISYYLSGNEPEATDTAEYYLDHLELQRVDPDHIEGWNVWPGRISYPHTGYLCGAIKTAIASGLEAASFRVIDQQTGETVLTSPIQTVNSHLGTFQLLDFSSIRKAGTYSVAAGKIRSQPFDIGPDVWRNTITKALNFFYVERCGMPIPGVHGPCHRDWTCRHGDQTMVINGGWHDAGDLTQGLGNTAEAVYDLYSLAEYLYERGDDPVLYDRVLEEACWGLDWIMKTSFRNGYRNGGSVSSRRTNGIIGDNDDISVTARNSPMDHFVASAAEAIACRLLRKNDPRMAALSLEMAEEDWRFALDGWTEEGTDQDRGVFRGTFDSDNVALELPAAGIMAAVDLWKATGNKSYLDRAAVWSRTIIDSQQRTRPEWKVPFTGFFNTGQQHEHILHYCHRGREHTPIMALTMLCVVMPDHPDWMKWYATVALHARYLQSAAAYTAPYGMIPASIYSDQEYLLAPESRRESFREQVLNGVPLGGGHYLRLFPVWMDYRGHFGIILTQAKAIACAGDLRGDLASARLAQRQLEWVIGRNPFSQSTMWGEGYDFPPLYTPLSGDMVGGLPVGIQTRGSDDIPYWPVQSTWTYKEIWSFPVICWITLMQHVAGPALVEGLTDTGIEFRETGTEEWIKVKPGPFGRFRVRLPQGNYAIRCGETVLHRTFLPSVIYQLDLRPGKTLDFELSRITSPGGSVSVVLTAHGSGRHRFAIRTDNVTMTNPVQELNLTSGKAESLEWKGEVMLKDSPWIAVVVPDGDLSQRREIMGTIREE